MKIIKPEVFYEKSNLNGVEIVPFETAVVGTAIRFDANRREVVVDLGYGWYGTIPENQVSVYDFTYSEYSDLPHQITFIIGKQIRAIVVEKVGENTLKLSRKLSMIDAWYNLEENNNITACVTRNMGYGIFLDIGNGLVSYNPKRDCSTLRISDTNIWYKVGDFIKVKLLSKGDKVDSTLICSHKLAYPEVDENINAGDIIAVRIGWKTLEGGYFCEVTPRISGIIDTTDKLQEGQMVKGIVKRITEKGVKLRHIS